MRRDRRDRKADLPDGGTGGPDDERVLVVSGVHHTYGRTPALRGASLEVRAGEVVAVTGPSGSGKSTLLHAAAGLLRTTSGQVRLFGMDVAGLSDDACARLRRSDVGVVLQYGQLVPELTALDNVALPLLLEGTAPAQARQVAADWLGRSGAGDLGALRPGDLSAGEAQRVAVARALVTRPLLVLADEPTGSLDAAGGRELLALLLDQARACTAALVLVTHDNTVAAHADREVRLVDGVVASVAVLR